MTTGLVADGHGHVTVAFFRAATAAASSTDAPWDFVVADSADGGRRWNYTTVAKNAWFGAGIRHQSSIWDLVGLARAKDGSRLLAWPDQLGKRGGPMVVRFARSR